MIDSWITRAVLGAGLLSLLCTSRAQADIIARWTFETSMPSSSGPFAPEFGSGAASAFHAGDSTYPSLVGNGSAHSYSSNDWQVGDYYQFTISTAGYHKIGVSWDQASSITGPGYFDFSYSTDGANFTKFNSYLPLEATWSATTFNSQSTITLDLSSVASLDNAANIYIRLLDTSDGATGGGPVLPGGTSSVDNFTFSATASSVPEPSSILLSALLTSGLVGIRIFGRTLHGARRRSNNQTYLPRPLVTSSCRAEPENEPRMNRDIQEKRRPALEPHRSDLVML
jgi:hypothetical protein